MRTAQQVDQIAEAVVALAWPWRQGNAVQLLGDVETQRQAGEFDGTP
jgi:hypothetical protein